MLSQSNSTIPITPPIEGEHSPQAKKPNETPAILFQGGTILFCIFSLKNWIFLQFLVKISSFLAQKIAELLVKVRNGTLRTTTSQWFRPQIGPNFKKI